MTMFGSSVYNLVARLTIPVIKKKKNRRDGWIDRSIVRCVNTSSNSQDKKDKKISL